MARETIDYGIDLGTTNSSVAVLVGTTTEIIPNKEGAILTPSALWFDKRGKMYVGHRAKNQALVDEENAAVEFKLRMGQSWRKKFPRSGLAMLPEEMSAEILKSLKTDVSTNRGEDITAAVITVPAAFEVPQCEATRRAGELAGLALCPLLQEPVAAALAYGFQSEADNVFWLVYDFGGGTFDAAIIQARDGIIQVVNHAGDNYLGGKNIDWDIVEKLLIPALKQAYGVRSFPDDRNTRDPRWISALAKLKLSAEEAKIQVSRTKQPQEIWIEGLCENDSGELIDFQYELTPAELQAIIDPWVRQSISLCRKALHEKGLSGRNLEKIILVGGTTLFPWLRDQVAAELECPVEFSVDPVTVVARGAAIFAGTQRLPASSRPVRAGAYTIHLEYEPVGNETDPLVGGRITPPPGGTAKGLRVEIVETVSQWRSGIIPVSQDGTFLTEVHAEKGRKCEFEIILMDAHGARLQCSPDRFVYTVGMVMTSPPLTHNLGVADAYNKPQWLFKKGQPLPTRATVVFRTAKPLVKNQPPGDDNIIKIPVIEGTNDTKADRNRQIGSLKILPSDPRVKRDVPVDSEVEVTIEIDASRTTKTKAYIPILDEEFEAVFRPEVILRSAEELRRELDSELRRLMELERKAEELDNAKAMAELRRIEEEQLAEIVSRQVAAAQADPDARGEADRKLLDLKAAVDRVENALAWSELVQEARELIHDTREIVDSYGNSDETRMFNDISGQLEHAIEQGEVELLRERMEVLRELGARVLLKRPEFWIMLLEDLEARRERMENQQQASMLFARAHSAINSNDIEALKAAVRQLLGLLPPEERQEIERERGYGGTLYRV